MSAPTRGPFHAYQCGEWVFIDDRVGEALAEIVDVSKRDDAMALAHLLAASWSMREAITEHLDDLDNGRPINTAKLYAALAAARGEGR